MAFWFDGTDGIRSDWNHGMISVLNRNLRKFKIALAMGGSALFVMGSGPVARGALPSRSSAEEVEIRMTLQWKFSIRSAAMTSSF